MRNGRIVYEDAFGYQDKVTGTPMRKDSLFRIYSMTKPITSLGVMMLLEKGKFLLTDPIQQYISAFENVKVAVVNEDDSEIVGLESPQRPITIQDLLRHTSGLTYGFFGNRTAVRKAYIAGQAKMRGADLRTGVDRLAELPLIAHPGTRCDTGFYIPKSQLHRAAQGYDPKTEDYPASLLDITKPPVFESGGGGLVSSMYDYARFCQLILNGGELDGVRLVGRKTVELMSADHLSQEVAPGDLDLPGPGQGFGLGFAVRKAYIAGQAKMRGADLRTGVDRLAELPLIAHPGTRCPTTSNR
jgi:CubicO group peptidase (beta-lactamase class C family)